MLHWLHCSHMSQLGSRSIAVRIVDTDVVALAIVFFKKLNIEHLLINFGVYAFVQHLKRAIHQAVHFWLQCLVELMIEHDLGLCGWSRVDDKRVPLLMTLREVAKSCTELVQCSCKKGCTARCKMRESKLAVYTAMRQCDGDCDRT